MKYGKEEAVMTRGLAILSMVCLHLFCRLGSDVVCQPLLWINSEKPFVYWIGFFCEICVPLYSMCAGYAQYLMFQKNRSSFKLRGKRILKLLKNYWIILAMFCLLGIFFDTEGRIPGGIWNFLKSIVLLHSYNGTWWYLKTYIILLLIPAGVLLFPVKKINAYLGVVLCLAMSAGWYLAGKFQLTDITFHNTVFEFIKTEILNLIHVLPFFWIGAFLCKANIFEVLGERIQNSNRKNWINAGIIVGVIIMFVVINLLEKAVLIYPAAVVVFLSFNLIKKPVFVQKLFLFLGKHSTNIWLTHMFFLSVLFIGLVWKAKYPVLIVLFMLVLCVAASYAEMLISFALDKITALFRAKTNESV
ncbi:MAG: acyltransferase [Clostridia bacterium]|nr:acyltransferase [Clostridia bacterium]